MSLVIKSIPYRIFLKAKITDMSPSFAKMSRKKIMLHSGVNCNKRGQNKRYVHDFLTNFQLFIYFITCKRAKSELH